MKIRISFAIVLVALTAVTAIADKRKLKRSLRRVPGLYIVVIAEKAAVDEVLDDIRQKYRVKMTAGLLPAVAGGEFEMSEDEALIVAGDARVEAVWEETQVSVAATALSWNVDRIDNEISPRLDDSFNAECRTGRHVRAYVIDTGIWAGHDEFSNPDPIYGGPRVPLGYDYQYANGASSSNRSNNPPCSRSQFNETEYYGGGHGTAVASVLGGRTLGVAREAVLVPVRVMDCTGQGTEGNIIKGINWVLSDPGYSPNKPLGFPGRVVNMSFTKPVAADSQPTPLENAVSQLWANGITVVVAAGNSNQSTAAWAPARMTTPIVVGGTKGFRRTDPDTRWNDGPTGNEGSNYGPSVDLSAPADLVLVAAWASTTATRPLDNRYASGTSFATPLAAGWVARYLQSSPSAAPSQVFNDMISGALDSSDGLNLLDRRTSPNRMLFTPAECLNPIP